MTFDDGPAPSPQPVTPQPIPTPLPYPVPTPAPATSWVEKFKPYGPWVLVVLLTAALAWHMWRERTPTPGPTPTPTVDAVTLGKQFAPKLAASLADGFETAATMIAAGTSVTDADNALKTKFATGRNDAFKSLVAPEFSKILPEGQEPKDPATREAFAKLHRDFASGLRGAK